MRECGVSRCRQQVYAQAEMCTYHEKLRAGLLEKATDYLSDTQIDAMMGGRTHEDGRKLDGYISSEVQP